MARRSKSQGDRIFEALMGLVPLLVLGWIFSPEFRAVLQIVGGLLVLVFGVWICLRLLESSVRADSENILAPSGHLVAMAPTTKPSQPSLSERLRGIDWFQFEKLIAAIYQHHGYSVQRLGGANADGGVDLIIKSTTEQHVVQCKHWRKWSVGVRHIREFLGTLTDAGIPDGIFITLTGYSGDAKQLAEKHRIQILNETDIIRMLEESGLVYSQPIADLLSDSRKYCPKCEREMVLRTARVTRKQFWGCSNYPRCKFVLDAR